VRGGKHTALQRPLFHLPNNQVQPHRETRLPLPTLQEGTRSRKSAQQRAPQTPQPHPPQRHRRRQRHGEEVHAADMMMVATRHRDVYDDDGDGGGVVDVGVVVRNRDIGRDSYIFLRDEDDAVEGADGSCVALFLLLLLQRVTVCCY